MYYSKLILAALLATVSSQQVDPSQYPDGTSEGSYSPPQAPRPPRVSGTPLTVDAGDFAQVDLQPNGGPLKVDAPLTKLHVDRQTGDVNLRAGPVALDVDTSKGGKPFGLNLDIPRIFNLRIGHQANNGQGVNVEIPILRELGEFFRRIQDNIARQPFPPAVLPPQEVEIEQTKRKGIITEAPPAKDQENLI